MEQGLKSRIAIIGGGPAGCACACFLKQKGILPIIFEKNSPLKTLLPTGGGRCNLAHAEFDLKELAANYPRGEKFLYSVFSRFGTSDTLEFFEKIGIKTYIQDDMRIFPVSDKASDVRNAILEALKGVKIIKENVISIKCCNGGFEVRSENKAYFFEKVVIAIGGHSAFSLASGVGHKIIEPKPALTVLKTKEVFSFLSGVSLKNITAVCDNKSYFGDFLFTHEGISGPLVYKITSIMAREKFPYKITFNFMHGEDLQEMLNKNPHKNIKNIISEIVPKSLAETVLKICGIDENLEAHKINGKMRDRITNILSSFTVEAISTAKGGEVVTCGGVSLDEVDNKTMESKICKNLYFCGEILDIDGFCGGFNLQNCWSTGFLAAEAISSKI